MNLLAIDTSGPSCGVAVLRDERLAYEGLAVNRMTHSHNLMPMVEEGLTRAGLDITDIDLFAAVTGPGSFTGVRIGVSVVKGMAHAAGKPCVGVDALEALASGLIDGDALLCPIQDARAGQVYGAAFLPGMPPKRLMEDVAAKLDDYLDRAVALCAEGQRLLFTGDGVAPCEARVRERLGDRACFPPAQLCVLRPSCAALLALAHQVDQTDYLSLMPRYLRAPQAERERARRLEANAP